MINIEVNNCKHQVSQSTPLQKILEQLEITVNGIAIAINHNVIPKDTWMTTFLNNNDKVLIIKATQGG